MKLKRSLLAERVYKAALIKSAEAIAGEIIAMRRELHRYPELSFKETRTSAFVCRELDKLGIPYVKLQHNAIVAKVVGAHKGMDRKRLALRADMDALPIQEETELPFASENPGVMHACGHDGHTAMLLGAARLIAEAQSQLAGTVYLCFQPAEEVQGGSAVILDHLESEGGVDRVIAAHLWADLPSGDLSVVQGARMAAGDFFTVEVFGQGGHASRPDLCVDPIKPLCDIVLKLSALPANRVPTIEPAVVHIGKIRGGTVGNVFPQSAKAYGGIRSFSKQTRATLKALLTEVSQATARAYGARAEVVHRSGTPMLSNDLEAVDLARKIVAETALFKLNDFEPICASEDYGFYLEKYPGFMCFIGIRNEAKGLIYTQHHPKFDIDEDILAKGAAFFALYALEYLI